MPPACLFAITQLALLEHWDIKMADKKIKKKAIFSSIINKNETTIATTTIAKKKKKTGTV